MDSERPLRILALDGGGVRGLSEVLILKFLVMRLKHEEEQRTGRETVDYPRPWKLFDLICGTSTGGLLALMLGRLCMVHVHFKHAKIVQVHRGMSGRV